MMQANALTRTQRNMNPCSENAKYDEGQGRHWSPYCYDLQQSYFPWYNQCAPGYYFMTPPEGWCNVPVYTYPHSAPTCGISGDKGEKNSSSATEVTLYDKKDVAWKCESKIPTTTDATQHEKGAITFGLTDDHTVTPMDMSPISPTHVPSEVDRPPAAEISSKKAKFLEISLGPKGHSDLNATSRSHSDRSREKRSKDVERKSKVPLKIPLSPRRYSDIDANSCSHNDPPLERRAEDVELDLKSNENKSYHRSAALTEMRLVNTTQACPRSMWKDTDYPTDPRKRPLECNLLPRALKAVRFDRVDCVSGSSILDAFKMRAPKERRFRVRNAKVVPASNLQQGSEECSPLSAFHKSDTQSRLEGRASSGAAGDRSPGRITDSSFQSSRVGCNPSVNGDCSSEVVQCILNGGYEPVRNEEDLNFSSKIDVSMNLGGFILEEPVVLSGHLEKMEDSVTLYFD